MEHRSVFSACPPRTTPIPGSHDAMEPCPHCHQSLDPQLHIVRASLLELPNALLTWAPGRN
jgi:hypothetical protein